MSCSVEGGSPPFMAAIAAAPPGMAPRPAAAAAPLGAPAPAVAPEAGAAPRPAAGGAPTAAGAPAPNPPNPPAAPAGCRPGDSLIHRLGHGPRHLGNSLWNAAEHFTVEILDDLGTALVGPLGGGRHLPAVLEGQNVGKVGVGIGQDFIIVGMIRRGLRAAWAGPQGLDAQLLHHVLVILSRGPTHGGRQVRINRSGRLRLLARLLATQER